MGVALLMLLVGVFFIRTLFGVILLVLYCIALGVFAAVRPDLLKSILLELKKCPIQRSITEEKQEEMKDELVVSIKNIEQQIRILSDKQLRLEGILSHHQSAIELVTSMQQQIDSLKEEINRSSVNYNISNDSINSGGAAPSQYPITYYAQSVDSMQPLGFTQRGLTRVRDKSIFVLTITNETEAVYSLIPDELILNGVVSMFNPVITDSSDYDSVPPQINNIRTTEAGVLKFVNGVWQIIKKQKVNIV